MANASTASEHGTVAEPGSGALEEDEATTEADTGHVYAAGHVDALGHIAEVAEALAAEDLHTPLAAMAPALTVAGDADDPMSHRHIVNATQAALDELKEARATPVHVIYAGLCRH